MSALCRAEVSGIVLKYSHYVLKIEIRRGNTFEKYVVLYSSWDPTLFIHTPHTHTVTSDFLRKVLSFSEVQLELFIGDVVIKHLICQVLGLLILSKTRGTEKSVLHLADHFPALHFHFARHLNVLIRN